MQSQESLEKAFYEQLKPGDYVDAKNIENEWKLAKVIDRDHKCISLMFDGYPPGNDNAIISSLKMKPLRAVTKGYTGPSKDIYFKITSIPDLNRHINTIEGFLKSEEQPSAYKTNQFLRGELFSIVNSLIISELRYSYEELTCISRFLLNFIDRIGQICIKVKKYLQEYFESNLNNKYIYLSNFKIALIYSLQELLYLVYNMLLDGSTTPKLLKKYKNEIPQQNFYNNIKQYLNVLIELFCANDSNGRWLPTEIRILISKILLIYRIEKKFLEVNYDFKDYLEFYPYWQAVMTIYSSEKTEAKLIEYILQVLTKQSPFDAKLKSLVILKKILEKETKLSFIPIPLIIEGLVRKNVVESLLKFFNPEIFKRYVPILKIISETGKKSLTQSQIDTLFKIMKTCHESDQILIFETLINLSEFIETEALDGIYYDIESNVDLNSEIEVKFVRDFTINAISNFNLAKNKGYLNSFIGRKKQSNKYGCYGLSLLIKEIMDKGTKIEARNIPFTISNIGNILEIEIFQSERSVYMNMCIGSIQKRESFGQSVELLHRIICTYPFSSYVSDSQQSIVGKLDDKYRLVDTIVENLKLFEKEINALINGGKKNIAIKISFPQTVVNCHNLIESFNPFCKYPLKLNHIEALWHMPHIFDFLKKPRVIEDNKENQEKIPEWKKKYFKKLQNEMIYGILTETLKKNEKIIPSEECFDSVDELVISYNLGKNLELTERATVRYINYNNIVGINFYFRFLNKLIELNKQDWKENKIDTKGSHLTKKVILRIIELHLRPHDHMAIKKKIEGWMNCLKKIMEAIYKDSADLCVWAIEQFLELIKGRQFKEINQSGKYEIIVSFENRDKTICLPRNATILKLRESIMEAYKLKCNFQMFNIYLKREMLFTEEEDYSLNAIRQEFRGPTILVQKVQPDKLYPQTEAIQSFMNLLESEQFVYNVLFDLLKKDDKILQKGVWRLIDMIPVNKSIKNKMENCKDFSEEDWVQILSPTNKQMEEIQYSINIIYSLLSTSRWIELFKKTGGHLATEELYLIILNSNDPLSEKIVITLSKIILKILDHGPKQNEIEQGQGPGDQLTNLEKISIKIEESVEKEIMNHEKREELGDWTEHSIEYLNLILKVYIVVCLKKKIPSRDKLIEFLIDKQILLKVSDSILFEFKDTETVSFTEHIVLDKKLNLTTLEKEKLFEQFALKYMKIQVLATKKSTENYFILLIDILHMIDKDSTNTFQSYPQVVEMIKQYVYDAIGITLKGEGESIEINEEMIYGCLKLLNETYSSAIFNYNLEQVFACLLKNYTLHENNSKQLEEERSLVTVSKIKLRHKKLLYDVMKRMISDHIHLLDIFVDKLTPKLSNAEWRRNMLSSWSLEQQKKEKKNFCGLENLAATCYMNCLFQQLFMIKIFSDSFINVDSLAYKETPEINEIYQFQKLFVHLKYGNKPSYTTRPFCESFITYEGAPIDPTIQNDADEFFNSLMEKIESFLRMSNRHEILEETLQGKLSNQLNCEGCPHSSEKVEPFLSIGLDIKNKKTLEEALDGYVEGEILDGDNAYFCEKCEKKVRTMKRLCIKEAPNILVLVLKRFTFNFDEMRKIKINDELKFPQQLNIKKFTVDSALENDVMPDKHFDYKLRGIVIHAGSSEAGHYYSFIKQQNGANHKWFEFNDEIVEETDYKKIEEESFGGIEKDSEDRVEKYKNAYILFYEKENAPNCENQEVLAKQQSEEKQTEDTYSYEEQLAEIVKSENRTSEFLSIVLDQLFIRLCESITMCGSEKAHHFMILYFHTVLLRDKNKEEGEYLGNIYRTLIALLESNVELSMWLIEQINHNYIKEFLIEAPMLAKYLCLGFVLTAIKTINKYEIEAVKEINAYGETHALMKEYKLQTLEKEESEKLPNQTQVTQEEPLNEASNTEIDQTISSNEATQPEQTSGTNQEISVPQTEQEPKLSEINFLKSDQIEPNINEETSENKIKKKEEENNIVEETPEENSITKLIPCLMFCLKKKGMTPFAKIFTFLSSIPKYQKVLEELKYPQTVYALITEKKFNNFLAFESRESHFGHENPNCKEKETEISYNFLVESLKNFPGFLQKSQIIEILDFTFYRAASKSLCELLAKTSESIEEVQENIEYLHQRLMNDKYRREDVEKYLFLLRFYFLQSVERSNENREAIQFAELVKTVCISNFSRVIQVNDNSHLLMELTILEINKIAFKCENFKNKWISQVGSHFELSKALENWIEDSSKPHLMQKNEEWKRKLASLNASEKEVATKRNIFTQEKRTKWMLQNKEKSQNTQSLKLNKSEHPYRQSEADGEAKKKILNVPEIHSDLEDTEIDKEISVGFSSYRIKERLGALTKVEDARGNIKWAVLEKNDIDACLDF